MNIPPLLRCCTLAFGSLLYSTFTSAQFTGQTIAFVASYGESTYAMTSDIRTGGQAQALEVRLNDEGNVVALTDEATFHTLCWQVGGGTTNARFYPYALTEDGTYQPTTDVSLINKDDKLRLEVGTSDKPWKFNTSEQTWLYQYTSREKYGILFYANFDYFKLNSTTYTGKSFGGIYILARPALIAPHVFRDLSGMSSSFATACFPADVKRTDHTEATFYEIVGKDTDDGQLTALHLRPVSGDLSGGRPYIFRLNDDSATSLTAALSGNEASATMSNGLVGNLTDLSDIPVDMYVFPADAKSHTLPAGRAYIDPDAIETLATPDDPDVLVLPIASNLLVSVANPSSAGSKPDKQTYDLSGRKAGTNAAGILIQKGAKTVISR